MHGLVAQLTAYTLWVILLTSISVVETSAPSGRNLFGKSGGCGKRYVDLKLEEISLHLKVVELGPNF